MSGTNGPVLLAVATVFLLGRFRGPPSTDLYSQLTDRRFFILSLNRAINGPRTLTSPTFCPQMALDCTISYNKEKFVLISVVVYSFFFTAAINQTSTAEEN